MKFRPETTAPLRKLAEVLLPDETTLMAHSRYTRTEWER